MELKINGKRMTEGQATARNVPSRKPPGWLWMFCLRRLPMQSTLREYFESLVVTVILALFGTTFVAQAFKIPTPSMEDNLLVGDHLLVNKFVFGKPDSLIGKVLPFREIKHGDVIVFKYPEDLTKNYVSGPLVFREIVFASRIRRFF